MSSYIPPDDSDDYHPPPQRYLVVILAGELDTTITDGEFQRYGPGDVVLLDDLASKGHQSIVVGQPDCEFMFVGLAD